MSQPPIVVEKQLSSELQAGLNAYLDRVRGFMPGTTGRAPAQALQLIQVMHEAERFIEHFARPAESLRREGFPALGEQILAASRDVGQAKAQYFHMYTVAIQSITLKDRMRAQAEQVAVQQILAATYHQQAVFEKSARGLMAMDNHTCPSCDLFFGDAFPYFNFCPSCGAPM